MITTVNSERRVFLVKWDDPTENDISCNCDELSAVVAVGKDFKLYHYWDKQFILLSKKDTNYWLTYHANRLI